MVWLSDSYGVYKFVKVDQTVRLKCYTTIKIYIRKEIKILTKEGVIFLYVVILPSNSILHVKVWTDPPLTSERFFLNFIMVKYICQNFPFEPSISI